MKKIKIHPKPFSKKEWEFWEDRLGFFIQEFDDNVGAIARSNIEADEGDSHDHFLAGMAQGMWAVHNFIENRMVEDNDKMRDAGTEPGLHRAETIELIKKRKYVKSGKYKKKGRKMIKTPTSGHIAPMPEITIHNGIRSREGTILSSKEIMGILDRYYSKNDKRKRLSIDDILEIASREGRIPKGLKPAHAKKILADRFFGFVKRRMVLSVKKGRKNYYRLP